MKDVYKNYKKWGVKAKRQGRYSRTNFDYKSMVETLKNILDTNIPEFPKQMSLSLPKLKKVGSTGSDKIKLPKLKKVGSGQPGKIKLPKLKKL